MSEFAERAARLKAAAAGGGSANASAMDVPERGAGFMPRWAASWSDSPGLRMEAFAGGRPGAKYRIDPETGGIAYYDEETGEWYLEEPSGVQSGLLGALADMTGGGLPAEAGGLLGSLLGPAGAIGGAALGEGLKQGVQAIVDPRERSLMEGVGRTAVAGGLGALGEVGGLGLRRLLARAPQLGFDPATAQNLMAGSREFDIPLFPSEVSGNRELIGLQSLLHDSPRTGQAVNEALANRQGDIERAIRNYLGEISPYNGPFRADEQAARASMQARDQMVAERAAAAGPFYEQSGRDVADPSRALGYIEKRIAEYPTASSTGKQLRRLQRLLTEADDQGNRAPITEVSKLHAAKTDIDDMIERAKRAGDNTLSRELILAQRELLGDMDQGSKAYSQARQTFADESQPIDEFDATLVGQADKAFSDPTYRMSKRLFSAESSPYEVAYARDIIQEQSPEAWNALVRSHLQQTFDEMAGSASGGIDNIGGMFRKKIFGNPRQQKQLKIALGDAKYQKLERLMDVLEATGISSRGQSATEPRQQFRKQIEMGARPWATKLTSPYDWFNEAVKEKNLDDIYRNLVDIAMSDSRNANFSLDRAIRAIEKYQGKVPPNRSWALQGAMNLILQGAGQQAMMGGE